MFWSEVETTFPWKRPFRYTDVALHCTIENQVEKKSHAATLIHI